MSNPISKLTLLLFTLGIAFLGYYLDGSASSVHYDEYHPHDPQAILQVLRQGNDRFIHSARTLSCDTSHDGQLRFESAGHQYPFVCILCCCDSRVCPEIIFDQHFGSIFEIRNAGNVVDDDVMASMEYAVEHLHVPLIVIMGHKRCGAIKAVCDADASPLHHHLHELQKHMSGLLKPEIQQHRTRNEMYYDQMSLENARQQADILIKESHLIAHALAHKEVSLEYGIYDMVSGKVDFYRLSK